MTRTYAQRVVAAIVLALASTATAGSRTVRLQAGLLAPDGEEGDWFGTSVAVEGDTAIVGAYQDDDRRGSAYVFQHGASGWRAVAKLVAADGQKQDGFGWTVGLSGSRAVIGAWHHDAERGAAYVFERDKGGKGQWRQTGKLALDPGIPGDRFGYATPSSAPSTPPTRAPSRASPTSSPRREGEDPCA
ncbi:FG-GAP repeat protein [bacterium]|nr:FG-GAP repeat protein [bacterium]